MRIFYFILIFIVPTFVYQVKAVDDWIFIQKKNLVINEITNSDSLGEPIILKELKKSYQKHSTSGVIPKNETEKLYAPDSIGFFGSYNLVNGRNHEIVGQLIIHTTDKPENWHFDSENEIFISLSTNSPDIKIWDKTFINTSLPNLKAFIGNRFNYKKGQTLYADFGDFEGIFWLNNDIVYKLKINRK